MGASPTKYSSLVREGSGTTPGVISDTVSSENLGVKTPDFNCYLLGQTKSSLRPCDRRHLLHQTAFFLEDG